MMGGMIGEMRMGEIGGCVSWVGWIGDGLVAGLKRRIWMNKKGGQVDGAAGLEDTTLGIEGLLSCKKRNAKHWIKRVQGRLAHRLGCLTWSESGKSSIKYVCGSEEKML
jgi:hypothetical protein